MRKNLDVLEIRRHPFRNLEENARPVRPPVGRKKTYNGAKIDWDFSKYIKNKDLGPFERSIFPKNPKTGFFEGKKKAPAGSLGPQKAQNHEFKACPIPSNIIFLDLEYLEK